MGFFDWLRREQPIIDAQSLADYIDRQSAYLTQKGIYEYSRARSGPYSKMLLVEKEFLKSVNISRWRAFPLSLSMVGEMVDGVMRTHAGENVAQHSEAIANVVLSVFDRYPVPDMLEPGQWPEARAELATRLAQLALHPPKRVIDIPEPLAHQYFDLMPIEKHLRNRDFDATYNYLKISLCNIHEELCRRMDVPALTDDLRATMRNR